MSDGIKVTFSGETMEFSSALFGGAANDFVNSPLSVYCGSLDLDELHNALFYINRTVLKVLIDELEIPLDECDEFLFSAVMEALTKEYNVRHGGNPDMHIRKTVKYRGKDQK